MLSPDDFGVVGVVMVFVTFFYMLGDMGIGPAIIQNKTLEKNEIEQIFTFTFIISIFTAAIFCIFSYLIAWFYDNNIYIFIGRLLSISIIFSIINIVPSALIYKEKRFREIALGSIYINIIVGIISILCAFKGASYYTLVIQSICTNSITFLYNIYLSRVKLNFNIKFGSIKKISNYSKYQFFFNIINYFSRNSDNILIGKFMGANALGFYDKAYKLMLYPVQNLTFVITPVLHPILSEYQDNRLRIYEAYKKLVKILAILGALFSIICFFCSREIILILFGYKWIGSILTFKLLSITIIFQMLSSSSGVIFQSTGEVKKLFLSGWISAIVNVLGIVIGMVLGKIEFVAVGIMISFTLNFFQAFFILIKYVFYISYTEFLALFKNVIISTVITCLVMITFKFNINNLLVSLIIKLILCIVPYSILIFITKEYESFKIITNRGEQYCDDY